MSKPHPTIRQQQPPMDRCIAGLTKAPNTNNRIGSIASPTCNHDCTMAWMLAQPYGSPKQIDSPIHQLEQSFMDLQRRIEGMAARIQSIIMAFQCSKTPSPLQHLPTQQPHNNHPIMPPTLDPITICSPSIISTHLALLFNLSNPCWNSLTLTVHPQHLI